MITKILESIEYVVENSKHVRVNELNLQEFCKQLKTLKYFHWLEKSPCLLTLSKEKYLNFLFILNSISFCYWPLPKWAIIETGVKIDGAWGMICALMKAIRNGYPITDFNYLNEITFETFEDLFRTDEGRLPLLEERYKIIKALSKEMINSFQGNPFLLLRDSDKDINILLEKLINHFPFFEDIASYGSQQIYFYKKAQLLISDIDYLFKDDPMYGFENTNQLTACADYKIPYVLRNRQILEYSQELDRKINNLTTILTGSEEEIEIRAYTIWVVEKMKNYLHSIGNKVMSTQLNDYLWLLSQDKNLFRMPYHRTITTKY